MITLSNITLTAFANALVPLSAAMKKTQPKSIRSVQDILRKGPFAKILNSHNSNRDLREYICLQLSPISAAHCLSAQKHNDQLTVHADSPAWATKLRYQLASLIAESDRHLPLKGVKNVNVRVTPNSSPRQQSNQSSPHISARDAELIRSLADGIRDENLRKRWLRLARQTD